MAAGARGMPLLDEGIAFYQVSDPQPQSTLWQKYYRVRAKHSKDCR